MAGELELDSNAGSSTRVVPPIPGDQRPLSTAQSHSSEQTLCFRMWVHTVT